MRHKILGALTAAFGVVAPLVAGAVPAMAVGGSNDVTAQIPNEVIRGGVVVYKYDGETRLSKPQGGGDLAGAEFTITNTSENAIVYYDEFGHKQTKAPGESWVIKTVWDEGRDAYVAKTAVDALPYGSYHIQETKGSAGYGLADDDNALLKHPYVPSYFSDADRKWVTEGYDFEITEDGQLVEFKGETAESDQPGCYNPPIRGGIEAVKRDHDLLAPSSQGNASLEGGVFEIYNISKNPIKLWDHFDQTGDINHGVLAKPGVDNNGDGVADSDVDEDGWVQPGGKVATIVTGTDGRAQTFMDALPVGWYKVIEVKAPKGYTLEKQWWAHVEITNDDWDALVVTDCDDPVLRGGVQFKKSDEELGYDSTLPQGDAHLGYEVAEREVLSGDQVEDAAVSHDPEDAAEITIYNESTRGVYINDATIKRWGNNGYITYTKGWVEPGGVVAVVKTDQYGYAEVFGLPYGHYRAVETKASEGYNLNEEWSVEFDIDGENCTADGENIVVTCCGEDTYLPESVMRGDIELAKRDWETGEGEALGGATLKGAEFEIINASNNAVVYNGETYEVGEVVTTITTDETGYVKAEDLAYGTYLIRESKAPEGYVVNTQWFALVTIRDEGEVISGTEACPDSILTNDMYHGADGTIGFPAFDFSAGTGLNRSEETSFEVQPTDDYDFDPSKNGVDMVETILGALGTNLNDPNKFVNITNNSEDHTKFCAPVDKVSRNDLRFNKVNGDDSTQLANIAFVLRSKTTGEWHVLVTDENGIIDTTAWMADGDNLPSGGDYTWNLHSYNTNASDAAVTANEDGTFTLTDPSKLDPKAGIYFFGSADADREALDYVGALPYDEYELIELRGENNVGMDLVHRDITLKYADNDIVDLGTITNDSDEPAVDCPPNGTTIEAHKTVDAGANAQVKLGQELTYTITYKNTGAETAEHVRIRDYVSDGLEFVSAENGGVYVSAEDSANGRAYVEWVTDAVEPGAEGSVTFTYKVSTSTGKSIIANQAYFDAEDGDIEAGNPDNDDPAGRTNIVYNTTDGSETPSALDASKWVEGTAEDGSAEIGDTLTYHVKVTNVGGKTSGEIQINDVIPTGTRLASRDEGDQDVPDISEGGTTVGNYAVAWTLDPLDPGESHEVWFKVVVTENAFSIVRNSATYGERCGIDQPGGLNNKTNTVETPIVKHPDLTVEKSADVEKASAGQIVTYTIKITNNGLADAKNVVVDDLLPEGIHYISGSAGGDVAGELQRDEDDTCHVRWTVPSIRREGGSATLTFQVRVDEDNEIGAIIKNSATATPEGEDSVTSNEVDIPVVDALEGLDITKSSDVPEGERVMPGDEIHYTIEWTNNGDTPIYNFGVRDEIPEHTTFVDGSITVTGTDGKTNDDVEADHEQDGDGAEDGEDSGSDDGGAFECPVWAGDESVGNKTDFSAIKDIVMEGDGSATVSTEDGIDNWDDLMSAIAKLEAGQSIEFTVHHEDGYDKLWKLTVRADGSATLVFAIIAPSIEDGPNAAIGNGITGNYDKNTDAVYAIQDVINPGESGKLEFTVKVDEDVPDNTVISNHATYDDGVTGMPTGDLEHETNTVETIVGAAVLEGSKTVDKQVVAVGSELTYTVKVTNTGTGKATNVVIRDKFRDQSLKGAMLLPDTVKVEGGTSAEDSAELIRALNSESSEVVVKASELPAGETMTLTFSVRVIDADAGDKLSNTAQFGDDDETDQSTETVETTVAEPDLHIEAVSDPVTGSPVERGDTITYTFVVTNDADVEAEGVAVNAAIPEGATYVDGSADGLTMVADGVLGATNLTFAAHEAKTFTFKVTVDDIEGDAIVKFRATTGFDSHADKPLAIDSNEIEHTVPAIETNLKIAAEANPASGSNVAPGSTITYTVRVTNDTRIGVDGVAVRVPVPANSTLVAGSAKDLSVRGNVLYATDLSFDAFETKTFTFDVTVDEDAEDGESVNMQATCGIDASIDEPLPIASETLVHNVDVQVAHLSIKETADPATGSNVKRGDTITYTVTVTNDGEVDASGVAVNAMVDTSTTYVDGSATGGLALLGYGTDHRAILGATGLSIPKGGSRTFTFQAKVNDDVADGTIISNRATTGFSESAFAELDTDAEEVKHGVSVEQATLSIEASADPKAESTIKPGMTITYSIDVTNTSAVDANGVAVQTDVPAYTTLVKDSLDGLEDLGDGKLGATGISLKAGETKTVKFAVQVNDDIPAGYTIKMRATTGFAADATKPLAIDSNEVEHNMESVPPELDIKLEQDPADGSEVAPGDTLTYTVTVTNTGDSRARKVGIYDIAPFHTTFVEGSLKAGSEDDTTHIIEDKTFPQGILCVMAGDLEPGETATMTYQVVIDLDFTGIVRNQALWVSPAADPDASADDEGMHDFPFDFGQIMESASADDDDDKTETQKLFGFLGLVTPDGSFNASTGGGVIGDPDEDTGSDSDSDSDSDADTGTDAGDGSGSSNDTEATVKPKPPVDDDTTDGTKPGNGSSTNEDGSGESNETDADVNKPQIELTKSSDVADGAYVRQGDVITYTITATNVGKIRANGMVVEDALPEGIEFVADSAKVDNDKFTWHFIGADEENSAVVRMAGTLDAGEAVTLTFQVRITATKPTTIANKAVWYQSSGDTKVDGGESNTNEVEVSKAVIELTKTADVVDGAYVRDGSVVTYTLQARNMGAVRAYPQVTDVLPEGFTIDEATLPAGANYDAETRTVTFAKTTINPGEAVQYSFSGTVSGEPNTTIANVAGWTESETGESGESNDHEVTIGTLAIDMVKSADVTDGAQVSAGDVITYTIKVSNVGTLDAQPTVTDTLPEGLDVDVESLPEGAVYDEETRTVTFAAIELAIGDSAELTFKATVADGLEAGARLANTATWTDGDDTGSSNTHEVVFGQPAFTLVKSADVEDGAYVKAGQVITYTLTLTNTGDAAGEATVTDTLPEGVTLDESSLPEGATYDAETRTVSFAADALEVGEFAEHSLKVTVDDGLAMGTVIVNRASFGEGDTDKSNDHEVKVGEVAATLTKTADVEDGAYVRAGDTVTYTLSLANTGQLAFTPVFTDELPEGMTLVTDGMPEGMTVDGQTVTFIAPDELQPGDTATLEIKAQVAEDAERGTVLENKASWNNADDDESGESNTHQTTVGADAVTMVKTSDVTEGSYVQPGQTITYTIDVRNTGDFAYAPVVTDQLPEGMTVVAESLPEYAETDGNTLTFNFDELEVGAEAQITYQATVNEDVAFGTTLANTATCGDDQSNTNEVKVGEPVLNVSKTSDVAEGESVKIGDVVTYTISIENRGTADGVMSVTDQLPDGLLLRPETIVVSDGTEPVEDAPADAGEGVPATPGDPMDDDMLVDPADDAEVVEDENADADADAEAETDATESEDVVATPGDPMDDDMLVDAADDAANIAAEGNGIHDTLPVKAGQTVTVTYEAEVTGFVAGENDGELVNTVSVQIENTDKPPVSDDDIVPVDPGAKPDEPSDEEPGKVTVEKTGMSAQGGVTELYKPGELQRYKIVVTNGTDTDYPTLIVEDAPDAGQTIVSVTDEDGNDVSLEGTEAAPSTDAEADADANADADASDTDQTALDLFYETLQAWREADEPLEGAEYDAMIDALSGVAQAYPDMVVGEGDAAYAVADAHKKVEEILKSAPADLAGSQISDMMGAVHGAVAAAITDGEADADADANAGEDEDANAEADAKPEDEGVNLTHASWSTGELKAGESRTYIVTVKVKANAEGSVTNVANIYGADLTTPLATSTATLDEVDTPSEELKKGSEDLPTTGIAVGVIAVAAAGAGAVALGRRMVKRAGDDSSAEE